MSISDILNAPPVIPAQTKSSPVKRGRASVDSSEEESPQKSSRTPEKIGPNPPTKSSSLTPQIAQFVLSPRAHENSKARRSLILSTPSEIEALTSTVAPSLKEKLATCKRALDGSQNALLPIDERIKLLPRRASLDSSSGSYICKSETQTPLLVVKPALQESGARCSPTGKDQQKDGITPGESVVRELMAWLVQKHLNLKLSVPPVCLTTLRHPLFGNQKQVGQSLRDLQKLGIDLSNEATLYSLLYTHKEAPSFAQTVLNAKLQQPQNDLGMRSVPAEAIEQITTFCRSNKDAKMSEFSKALEVHFQSAFWYKEARPKIIQLWDIVGKETKAIHCLLELFTACQSALELNEALVSAHQFEENDGSLQKLHPNEHKHIPQEEFCKFILDILLFNTDRHLDNILVKKEHLGPNKYVYRLILIDHGFCLPRPLLKKNCTGLKQAEYEFLSFPQASCKIEGEIKNQLLRLDIEIFMQAIKEDLRKHYSVFPQTSCAIPDECLLLLEFNLRFAQKALRKGASLKEMAEFQLVAEADDDDMETSESGLMKCFKKVIQHLEYDRYTFNYTLLDSELENAVNTLRK